MHDFSTGRSGFDRVLAAVAATFLLTGTVTFAHADPAKPADSAISAAVPTPDTSNVPPPTAADVKPDAAKTSAGAAEPAKAADAAKPAATEPAKADAKPADAPKADAAKVEPAKSEPPKADTATTAPAAPAKTDNAKTETPTAAPAVATLDPSAEALRGLVTTKAGKYFDRKKEREAVEAFYKERNYAPLWTKGAAATSRANDAIARLKKADEDGLEADDYPVPNFTAAATPDAQADAELKLTESVLDYARHAQSGRMHWSQVSGDIQYPEHYPDPTEVLINVSTARNAGAALETYNPPHKLFQELKAKLAELRGKTDDVAKIADGEALRFVKPTKKNPNPAVMDDARVPALRAKLGVTENASDTHYDATVAAAVRKFQSANDIKATGVLDKHTVAALNGPKNDRKIDIVRVNMERWRWLPRDLGAAALGDAYVILNIPDYTLRVMHNGAPVWTTRVVTGKPGTHATPLLTETMKYITVNPTWNVPPSIIYNEYLPALQQDPTVLQRMGLKLSRNSDGTIHISQPPGEANALGRIRFNFPNKFLVYQHDTPDKYLFAKSERAFSHGCMRVQNPDQYAATLLGIALPKDHYTPEKIRSMYGHNEININLPTPIPVNITYQTAFVDDAGKLEFRKDIYGRDATMIKLLKEGGRRNLETVVAHSQPNYVKPAGNINIPGDSFADSHSSAPNFFQMLFGGGGRAEVDPEPVRGRRRHR
jgi:murein L,D-transpeptidase YcbB/YkuD